MVNKRMPPKMDPLVSLITFPHDDVIKWKYFPRYWPFVRGIHRSPVNSPHKGQWRGALMFTLICARINGWVNDREAGDLRRYCAHYDVIVMESETQSQPAPSSCQPHVRLSLWQPELQLEITGQPKHTSIDLGCCCQHSNWFRYSHNCIKQWSSIW